MSASSMSVREAFEMLQEAVEAALRAAETDISRATQARDFEAAQRALDHARVLDHLRARLSQFQAEFDECVGQSVEVAKATPIQPTVSPRFVPTIRHGHSHDLSSKARDEYYRPILETLVELGGRAEARVVLERVYEKMQTRFTDDDLAFLPSGGQRWHKEANFARNNMRDDGLLRDDSPRGVWEVTAEGRAWLERRYS